MSFTDKAKSKAQEMAGAAKERIGDATDNERMRAEGAAQQQEARGRQAGERAGQEARQKFSK
ncbi:CsbD-like protein [Micromonospora olivasterospora]|uniref:CsbD-like protein n=2 Tax=Micromonospora olivasterospora TaxID=1880 RepID=A0A562IGN8_MICOL|nr:CsbD family protein [Micromonospora olivasterospora]TWH70191.1 CsbD-like protein [Micromonospora olivasterospora]